MAPVHLVIITTGINLFILPIFPVPCEGGWARTLLNFSELKKVKVVPVFPPSYQSTEPHALPISALEGRGLDELKKAVEEEIVNSTGKHILDLQVDLSTPQLRWNPLLSPLCFFFLMFRITRASTVSVPLHPQLAVQGSHRQGRAGECRWRLSCCQGHHQHRCLRTLQETVRRQIAERDPSCCTSKKTTVTFTFVKCFKIFKVWFCKRMTYLLVNT